MKEILLTQDRVALVDDEDYDELSKHKWCADEHRNTWYAVRRKTKAEGFVRVYMHRELLVTNMDVDHIDRNGLNNQRHNLRPCTRSQNLRNCIKRRWATSQYHGVHKMRGKHHVNRKKKWVARNRDKNGVAYTTYYKTEIEAAIRHDDIVRQSGDEFARLNFPEGVV